MSILDEASGIVHGSRQADYDHPYHNWTRTAGMATAMLKHKLREDLTASDLLLIMQQVKISREMFRPKKDNRIDGAGYWEVLDMVHNYKDD